MEPATPKLRKILLIDDDKLNRELLARTLEKEDLDVIECADGVEALQMLKAFRIALLVLDYEMPELNGAQICEIIRKDPNPEIAQVPIIFLTAHQGDEHELECLKAGADDFVTKPINLAVLKARIQTHLRLSNLRRQLQAQNKELETWRHMHEFDLESARLTQRALFPQKMPSVEGWNFASHYQPLIQVGGDIFDRVEFPSGRILFWIADATGHGVAAALITTLTKLLFQHAASISESPKHILELVNRDLFGIFKGRSYMTAACLVVEPETGECTVAGAGHPPVLILQKEGGLKQISSTAPPLGVAEETHPQDESILLQPGDAFALCTDGVYGMPNKDGDRMELEYFLEHLPDSFSNSSDLVGSLLKNIHDYAGNTPLPDDIAIIAGMRS